MAFLLEITENVFNLSFRKNSLTRHLLGSRLHIGRLVSKGSYIVPLLPVSFRGIAISYG